MTAYKVPPAATPIIGRETEVAEILRLLAQPDCRLLTLAGPGGIGKTRLAVEAAGRCAFEHGACFVLLQALASADLIVPAIADALDFQFYGPGDPFEQLTAHLKPKTLLLALDNFEHLLDGVEIAGDLLAALPGLKLLVTSREALNLREEYVYPVKGMHFPEAEPVPPVEQYSAVRLFVQNARRMRADFSLEDEQAGVIRICRLVGGMPLGLELAAAWVRALSCDEIAREIERSMDILESPARNSEPRHRSMRAALDHSWALLGDDERDAFQKLAVFRGGFTREAAEFVAGASLKTISGLVDKSLVRLEANGRYDLHQLLRQFGSEQLEASGRSDAAHDAHSAYFLDFLARREAEVKGGRQLEALNEIETDFDNVRAAWKRAVLHAVAGHRASTAALMRGLEGLTWFCLFRSRFQEAEQLFEWSIVQSDPASRADLLPIWGGLAARRVMVERWRRGVARFTPELEARLRSVAEAARQRDDRPEMAHSLLVLGILLERDGCGGAALAAYENSLDLYRALNDPFYMAWTLHFMTSCCCQIEGLHGGLRVQREAFDLRQAIGDEIGAGFSLLNIGLLLSFFDDHLAEAERYLEDGLDIFRKMDTRVGSTYCLGSLAWVRFLRGDLEHARQLAETELKVAMGPNVLPGTRTYMLAVLGAVACVADEDYVRGQDLCREALLLGVKGDTRALNDWSMALAACGLGDFATALRHIMAVLQFVASAGPYAYNIALENRALVLAGVILAQQGEKEWAVEVIALGSGRLAHNWLEQWRLMTRLYADLKAELGPDTFAAAWQRGQSQDPRSVRAVLLRHFEQADGATPPSQPAQANRLLVEPLSARELDVLRLIAQGLSNAEIAQRLYVGESTVKKHINHLYGKLSVSSRAQAMLRAGELNLL